MASYDCQYSYDYSYECDYVYDGEESKWVGWISTIDEYKVDSKLSFAVPRKNVKTLCFDSRLIPREAQPPHKSAHVRVHEPLCDHPSPERRDADAREPRLQPHLEVGAALVVSHDQAYAYSRRIRLKLGPE